jgi:addiction module HigA family antidote
MAELKAKRPNRRPTHPGAVLREDVLPTMDLSVSEFARRIGISRQRVHKILAETDPVTPNTALRIGKLVGNGPEIWLSMQQSHDLWLTQQELKEEIAQIKTYRAA